MRNPVHRFVSIFVVMGLISAGLGIAAPAQTNKPQWSWVSATFAPCEGLGIHGSYRVFAEPDIKDGKLAALAVWASSAAFTTGSSTISVKLEVVRVPAPIETIFLVDAGPSSLAAAPQPNETKRKYLPPTASVDIPKNTVLKFTVTAVVSKPEGSCALGTTVKEIRPSN